MTQTTTAHSEPMLRIKGLVHTLGNPAKRAFQLRIQQLEIFSGEWVVIEGYTGCGKSTVVQILGLARAPQQVAEFHLRIHQGPFASTIHDLGALYRENRQKDIEAIRRRSIGHLLQRPELLPALTVAENIVIPLRFNQLPVDRAELMNLLTALSKPEDSDDPSAIGNGNQSKAELAVRAHQRPHQLSGGQQQRAALARGIIHRPKLFIADEPTSSLDRRTAERVMDFLDQVRRRDGMTIIMVSHDDALASKYADRILHMDVEGDTGTIVGEKRLRSGDEEMDFSIDPNCVANS